MSVLFIAPISGVVVISAYFAWGVVYLFILGRVVFDSVGSKGSAMRYSLFCFFTRVVLTSLFDWSVKVELGLAVFRCCLSLVKNRLILLRSQ